MRSIACVALLRVAEGLLFICADASTQAQAAYGPYRHQFESPSAGSVQGKGGVLSPTR